MPVDSKTSDGHESSSLYFEDNIHAEAASRGTKLCRVQALIIHEIWEMRSRIRDRSMIWRAKDFIMGRSLSLVAAFMTLPVPPPGTRRQRSGVGPAGRRRRDGCGSFARQ
jgi:hypothetical protein